MNHKIWLIVASLLGAVGVTLGAFQAHGLEKMLAKKGHRPEVAEKKLDQCEVGVRYQMYHVLALFGVGLVALYGNAERVSHVLLAAAGILFLAGIALFSGGLYLIVFLDNGFHWSLVPAGGLAFILGWLMLAGAAVSLKTTDRPNAA